ncbi:bifunctional transcriptional regulator/biotin --[acetyl-CoA-carboxylase] ligase [Actinobaculum suis]|uniref:Bifunctional transcriptional regulator/biotin --[acetyl-CoA-carboxylase] ligase n=1 Tax=Actinobaculum suis TaxID=1657 RepID=A0A7Z9C991_9ACTO|nr:biotin--[acetyl-CoA-carboxylase] ligase [Actinobaculum suis]VDG76087.1 bifunctional transcriptional regulator/biotin --[acetyl-CoA-carboxylase] ligase [Actinobaculum suis]
MEEKPLQEAAAQFPQLAQISPRVLHVERTGSTQDDLVALWQAGEVEHGCVLIADDQSAGRGRVGRHWYSAPGSSLLISTVLEVSESLRTQIGWLTLAAAAAARQALAQLGIPALISWPNDLVLHPGAPRKLGGILGEIAGEKPGRIGTVVGAGINLQIAPANLPTPVSTSVVAENLPVPSRDELAAAYLAGLLARLVQLEETGSARQSGLLAEINQYCETLREGVVVNRPRAEPVCGRGVEVTENGGIVLETENGLVTVTAGEVSMIEGIIR